MLLVIQLQDFYIIISYNNNKAPATYQVSLICVMINIGGSLFWA